MSTVILWVVLSLFQGQTNDVDYYSVSDFASVKEADVHVHVRTQLRHSWCRLAKITSNLQSHF